MTLICSSANIRGRISALAMLSLTSLACHILASSNIESNRSSPIESSYDRFCFTLITAS